MRQNRIVRTMAAALVLCLLFACTGFALAGEADGEVRVTAKVMEVEKYGHARLDMTIGEFEAAGFALGDVVTVTAGGYTGDMPYFNGYYVDRGEYMLRAYPGQTHIAVCINYGKFCEAAGIGVGDEVTITLKEKAGALLVQEINNLVYSQDRADYDSDEVFANFREVTAGSIPPGTLYRSASPVNDEYGRAAFACALMEPLGIGAVMNLANTEEELLGYFGQADFSATAYRELYEAGRVIALGMSADFTSPDFNEGLVRGLTFLSGHDAPYLVHCTEGKDRAGFASMMLEMLGGAALDEIVTDYMLSYVNYYGVEPGSEKYDLIAQKNVIEMLKTVTGADVLEGVDLQAAAMEYLRANGMEETALNALVARLTGNN